MTRVPEAMGDEVSREASGLVWSLVREALVASAASPAGVAEDGTAATADAADRRRAPQASPRVWARAWQLVRSNSVEGLTWAAARHRPDLPRALRDPWSAAADETLWRCLQFDIARERVVAALTARGFELLPLKGAVVAPLYPDPSMRSMVDNDILYRLPGADLPRAQRELARAMASLGFEPEHVGEGCHDTFVAPPCLSFEMHHRLFQDRDGRLAAIEARYRDPWALAGPGPAPSWPAHEHYLYHICHAYKHYEVAGCGIRCLADEMVLLEAWGDELDLDRIEAELAALGPVAAFERRLRRCAQGARDPELIAELLGSGAYGTVEGFVGRGLEAARRAGEAPWRARARYVRGRLLPRGEADAHVYRVAGVRLPVPLALPFRVGRALTVRLPRTLAELRALMRSR